jgi:streptogramin lyase
MRILRFLANGNFDMEFTPAVAPSDVAVGPDGNIYVIGYEASKAYQYSPSGALLLSFQPPNGLEGALRITIDPTGTMFITDRQINKFQIDTSTSTMTTTLGRLKAMYR